MNEGYKCILITLFFGQLKERKIEKIMNMTFLIKGYSEENPWGETESYRIIYQG